VRREAHDLDAEYESRRTDCAAQHAGAKRPCGIDLNSDWLAVNAEALKLPMAQQQRAWRATKSA
jgi:hypothetical protein